MQSPDYSTKTISRQLIDEICTVLKDLDYGSVEIHVVDREVTQITKRQIRKTKNSEKRK